MKKLIELFNGPISEWAGELFDRTLVFSIVFSFILWLVCMLTLPYLSFPH